LDEIESRFDSEIDVKGGHVLNRTWSRLSLDLGISLHWKLGPFDIFSNKLKDRRGLCPKNRPRQNGANTQSLGKIFPLAKDSLGVGPNEFR
jgi:hypothetical protein